MRACPPSSTRTTPPSGGVDVFLGPSDPRLPDADGLTFAGEVRRRLPGIRVVLYGPGKDDAVAVAAALGLAPEPGRHLAVVELLRGEVGALAEDWRELCRWDPLLP